MKTLTAPMFAPLALVLALVTPSVASAGSDTTKLDMEVMTALNNCIEISESCAQNHINAVAALVFPYVTSVELGKAGAGGKGALVLSGKIVDYFGLGAVYADFEDGVDVASYIFLIESPEALSRIRNGNWHVGSAEGIIVIDGGNATSERTADVVTYVVGGRGLDSNVSIDLLHTWPE